MTLCCFLLLFAPAAWAMDSVQTGEGRILVKKAPSPGSVLQKEKTVPPDRDPFNWDSELVDTFEPYPIFEIKKDIFAGLELTAIMWDEKLPLAVINDTLLQRGDTIRGASVTRIFRDKVLLQKEQQLHTLKFGNIIDLDDLLSTPKGGRKK